MVNGSFTVLGNNNHRRRLGKYHHLHNDSKYATDHLIVCLFPKNRIKVIAGQYVSSSPYPATLAGRRQFLSVPAPCLLKPQGFC